MRELVYYIAVSQDGFIARSDGSFSDFPWDDEFISALEEGVPETLPAPMRPGATRDGNKRFDAVLMGRRTYEVGSTQGLTNPYPTLDQFVVSQSMEESPDAAVALIRRDVLEEVRRLKDSPGRAIWLCGGSELATPVFQAGLVDRLILKVAPVVFGSGIPLFTSEVTGFELRLESRRLFESGYSIVEYAVGRREPERAGTHA